VPRCPRDVILTERDGTAPRRRRRRDPQSVAEEREGGQPDDDAAGRHRGVHQQIAGDVRQHVFAHDDAGSLAEASGGVDPLLLCDLEGRATHRPPEERPPGEREDEREEQPAVEYTRYPVVREHGADHDEQQQSRHGDDTVGGGEHAEVDAAAVERRHHRQHAREERAQADSQPRDDERDARTTHHEREQVAAVRQRPERMEPIERIVGHRADVLVAALRLRLEVGVASTRRLDLSGVLGEVPELVAVRRLDVVLDGRRAERGTEQRHRQEQREDDDTELTPTVVAQSVHHVVGGRPVGAPVMFPEDEPATEHPVEAEQRVGDDEREANRPRDGGFQPEERPGPRPVGRSQVPVVRNRLSAEERRQPLRHVAVVGDRVRQRRLQADHCLGEARRDVAERHVEEGGDADDERVEYRQEAAEERAEFDDDEERGDGQPPDRRLRVGRDAGAQRPLVASERFVDGRVSGRASTHISYQPRLTRSAGR